MRRAYSGRTRNSGDGYEPGIMYVYFDTKNQMHVAYMMQDQYDSSGGGYNGFYLAYACSDDGGATFRRADGTQYAAIPITHNSGDAVVGPSLTHTEGARYGLYSEAIGIGRGGDGKIMVTFAQGARRRAAPSSITRNTTTVGQLLPRQRWVPTSPYSCRTTKAG